MVNLEWGRAICYSGYRENQSPKDCTYPEYGQTKEDLEILVEAGFKYIRMYDPVEHAEIACKVIRECNMPLKVMLGPGLISEHNNPGCTWVSTVYTDEELEERARFNDRRIDELIRIANEYTDVIFCVSVGNENTPDWGANMVKEERLISFAKKLKAGTGKLTTFNEGIPEWKRLQKLAEYMDIISIHSYPLWYGLSVEDAVRADSAGYKEMKEMYPDKVVLFSEVGWTTSSVGNKNMKPGEANEDNQKRYYNEFWEWSDKERIIAFMFEAFDEPWKGGNNPEEAEKNWGIYKLDRTPKKVMEEGA